jgi:hypothetical protein
MTEPSSPPIVSPDGRFYWDGGKWLPMPAVSDATSSPTRVVEPTPSPARHPPVQQLGQPSVLPATQVRKGHLARNLLVLAGALVVVAAIAAAASAGSRPHSTPSAAPTAAVAADTPVSTPVPTPTPISEQAYKASAQSIPYPQLIKDPASEAGTVVTYTAQVFQYDANTTTSHMLVSIDMDQYGYWSDNVFLDLPGSLAQNDFTQKQTIKFWGTILGPYTYQTIQNGSRTVPEIVVHYIQHA